MGNPTNKLDMLLALGKKTGFSEKGEANIEEGEGATKEIPEKKVAPKQRIKGTDSTKSSQVKNTSLVDAITERKHPWLEAPHDQSTPFLLSLPADTKLLLEGIARRLPDQSMRSLCITILEPTLKELAIKLDLPLPDSMKD